MLLHLRPAQEEADRIANSSNAEAKIEWFLSTHTEEEWLEFAKNVTSKIEPNKELANCATWTADEIEARQNLFASYALKIWKK